MSNIYIALIPGRKNSKGLNNKNMRFIHGKPLVHYTLDAAENCNLINLIYVSSDNTKLLNYAKENFNVQKILRNEITSNDNATANAVVQHFLKKSKKI